MRQIALLPAQYGPVFPSEMNVIKQTTVKLAYVTLTAVALAACGGGGGGGKSAPANLPIQPPSNVNAVPTIQGQPTNSIVAGRAYAFQPVASDADGDSLTFAAANLPRWASFNASTGRISGTPTTADVATYSGITITVSDGKASASLPAFSIAVTDVAAGTAALSWIPPTQNSDGSALTDLAGYEVHYGRASNDLSQIVQIVNPSISSYVVDNLSSGVWYFAVVAVNSSGMTSQLSNVTSKTIG